MSPPQSTKHSNNSHTERDSSIRVHVCLIACFVLLGIFGFRAWLSDDTPSSAYPANSAVDVSSTTHIKNIENVQLGERVRAENPQVGAEEHAATIAVDPATWRYVKLAMTKLDASALTVELLRPSEWLEEVDAGVGAVIWLDLAELGAEGPAEVLEIKPCPGVQHGAGRVVTGKFTHESSDVLSVSLAGMDEPIGVTAAHPFWSEDRGEFVLAGELEFGEALRTVDGNTTFVTVVSRQADPQPVYNLEIETEHVYFVSDLGVLVHNGCARKTYKVDAKTGVVYELRRGPTGARRWRRTTWVDSKGRRYEMKQGKNGTIRKHRTNGKDPPEKHHSDPIFMGGKANQKLTEMPRSQHKQLHRDLNKHLKKYDRPNGDSMVPSNKNKGEDIRDSFSQDERRQAMADFYKSKDGQKYPDAARDFFAQHPTLK